MSQLSVNKTESPKLILDRIFYTIEEGEQGGASDSSTLDAVVEILLPILVDRRGDGV